MTCVIATIFSRILSHFYHHLYLMYRIDFVSGETFRNDGMSRDERRIAKSQAKRLPKKNRKVKEGSAHEESARATEAVSAIPDLAKRKQIGGWLKWRKRDAMLLHHSLIFSPYPFYRIS